MYKSIKGQFLFYHAILFYSVFYSVLSCKHYFYIGQFLFSILSCNSILFWSVFYSILYSILFYLANIIFILGNSCFLFYHAILFNMLFEYPSVLSRFCSILVCILFYSIFYSIISCKHYFYIGQFLFSILSCTSILFCSLFYSNLCSILSYLANIIFI